MNFTNVEICLYCVGQNAELRTLDYIKTDQIGMKDKPDYFQCKAMPAFIKSENCMYMVSDYHRLQSLETQ